MSDLLPIFAHAFAALALLLVMILAALLRQSGDEQLRRRRVPIRAETQRAPADFHPRFGPPPYATRPPRGPPVTLPRRLSCERRD